MNFWKTNPYQTKGMNGEDYSLLYRAIGKNDLQTIANLGRYASIEQLNGLLYEAAIQNNGPAIELLISLGANDYNGTLVRAIRYGHEDLVYWLINMGADNYNEGLVNATATRNIKLINLFLQLGADEYDQAINIAERLHRRDIFELLTRARKLH